MENEKEWDRNFSHYYIDELTINLAQLILF